MPMATFTRAISASLPQPLTWHRPFPRRRGAWELRAGDQLLATIRLQGWARPVAIAECASGRWEFVLEGWFRSRYVIRSLDTGEDVAILHRRRILGGGDLEFPDGTRYEARTTFRPLDLEFRLREGTPAFLSFRVTQLFRSKADVTIAPSADTIRHLPLLVCFGCYVLLDIESAISVSIIG